MEKFHGAVVDHEGSEKTREFREVADVGAVLARLEAVVGTSVQPEVAVIQDWENEWAIREGARIYLGENTKYREECTAHYAPFWQMGVPVDVMDQHCDLDGYKLVVVPMAYMLRDGFASRLKAYVAAGGTAVMTYWSGVVDSSDLCFLGGVPGEGLREVFGVWEEESQSYYPHESVGIAAAEGNVLGLTGSYQAVDTCSVVHAEGAEILATYTSEYFKGSPALTVHSFGKGKAYYIAARTRDTFLKAVYTKVIAETGVACVMDVGLPAGVTVQLREDEKHRFIFVLNFNRHAVTVPLDGRYEDLVTASACADALALDAYGVAVLKKSR